MWVLSPRQKGRLWFGSQKQWYKVIPSNCPWGVRRCWIWTRGCSWNLRMCFGMPLHSRYRAGCWATREAARQEGGFAPNPMQWPVVGRKAVIQCKQEHSSLSESTGTSYSSCLREATLQSHLCAWPPFWLGWNHKAVFFCVYFSCWLRISETFPPNINWPSVVFLYQLYLLTMTSSAGSSGVVNSWSSL